MFELVDLWHMVMHTKGNCIFSVSKLGGPKFFLFQEENHNGKVPHSSKHQPGLF